MPDAVGYLCGLGWVWLMRLLIIDDDALLRTIVKSKLESSGNSVLEAADGTAGWEVMQTNTLDCVLIDLGLPDMDGRDLIGRARKNPRTRHLPMIVITGRNDREAIDEAFEIGANYFLTKPINWSLFRHQIDYVMRLVESGRQARRAHLATQGESKLKDTVIGRLNYVLRPMAANIATNADHFASLLDGPTPRESLRAEAEHIRQEAHNLEMTLATMANFAALLNSGVDLNPRRLSLEKLLNGVMQSLQGRWASAIFQVDAPAYELWLHVDHDQLTRALVCLLDNAFRCSPVDRAVKLSAQHLEDGSVCFVVDDEGAGIASHKLHRLLAPMSAIDRQDRAACDVSGLGLATAKFIAEAHGGQLTVQSALGRGTSASIHLPSELISMIVVEAEADAA